MKSLLQIGGVVCILAICSNWTIAGNDSNAKGRGLLRWERREAEVSLKPGEAIARFSFPFVNSADHPVTITDLTTSCRCTTASPSKAENDKGQYVFAPGEKGSIDAEIDIGKHTGRIAKFVTISTDDANEPQIELVLRAVIPEAPGQAVLARADAPAAGAAPAAAPGPHTLPGVLKELASLDAQLQRAMPLPKAFLEPAKRRSIAGTVIPVMNRMLALYQEMLQIEPGRKSEVEPARLRVLSLLCLFGDTEAPARLKDAEAAGSPSAQLAQLMVEWWKAFGDQDAQLKLAGQIKPIAAAHPDDPGVLYQIVTMIRQGASSVAAREPLEQIVLHDLRGEGARQVGEQIAAQMKLRGMEGKPLTIAGQTLDGDKPFSTDEWKGRVIVVYFWATWCEPCKRELPELQDLYNRQHGRGLEIVGVNNDSPGDLKSFLAANKEIIWPQLPKKGPPGFHDLALKFQIDACGIPARFVIDRKGILRSVDPYENLEQRVTSLLDEKP